MIVFRSLDGAPVRSFGLDGAGLHRVGGQWVETQAMNEQQDIWIRSVSAALHALPRWPLADGIDRSMFTPDSHQLAVVDKLATTWMQCVDGISPHPRTRVVVADEGGIGKTLSVSIAVRWITLRPDASGPVLVLVPPLLTEHWGRHLRAVFSDDPDRVRVLSSARFFDASLHRDDIVVMSKFSWIHHIQSGQLEYPTSLCVVIDEAHQGRTGMGFQEIDSELFHEDGQGEMFDHEEINSTKQHAEVLQKTCVKSAYAIAVTATPINTDMKELNYILNNIGSESASYLGHEGNQDVPEAWFGALGTIKAWSREIEDDQQRCPAPLINALIACIDEHAFPPQWAMLSQQDIAHVRSWLADQTGPESVLTPSLTATMVREFHPYGRHLSMILRSDLAHEVLASNHFRARTERRIDLTYDENMRYFMHNVLRNGSQVAMSENLAGPARLVASYHMNPNTRLENGTHRYSGTWEFDGDGGLDWTRCKEYADPRVQTVLEQIWHDLEQTQAEGALTHQRGCVIFTEFRGTIYWLNQVFGQQQHVGNVSVVPFQLTGDTNIHEARNILDECRRKAGNKRFYPVLICTPAGEVGLDMEWATTLVHWDLNPNPQRLEQRTWRLDRRISSEQTCPSYTVLFPMLEEVPHYSALEQRILDRYDQANRNLFTPTRPYIPENANLSVNLSGSGSNHGFELLNDEVKELNRFLHRETTGGWPGPQLRQSEQLRLHALFDLVQFSHSENSFLEEGRSGPYEGWSGPLEAGDLRIALVRDLETLLPALSRSLSPQIPYRSEAVPLMNHWEPSNSEGIRLPNVVTTPRKLFRGVSWTVPCAQCPMIHLEGEGPQGTYLLAINGDMAKRDTPLSPQHHDRGLRVLNEEGEMVGGFANEEEAWAFNYRLLSELVRGQPSEWIQTPAIPGEVDAVGQEQAEARQAALKRRQEEQQRHLERLEAKLESMDEDDVRKSRFETACEQVEIALGNRETQISELLRMSHRLTVLAKFVLS
ncbi:MAG: hypothetical protein CMP75_04905 [Flavobacteriales bacterium]|nr:hypothetical protein [Flavobacteriales bacterium]